MTIVHSDYKKIKYSHDYKKIKYSHDFLNLLCLMTALYLMRIDLEREPDYCSEECCHSIMAMLDTFHLGVVPYSSLVHQRS